MVELRKHIERGGVKKALTRGEIKLLASCPPPFGASECSIEILQSDGRLH